MPFGIKPQCAICKATSSPLWERNAKHETVCSVCLPSAGGTHPASKPAEEGDKSKEGTSSNGSSHNNNNNNNISSNGQSNNDNGNGAPRKSTRARMAAKHRSQAQVKSNNCKGKGRRVIFKKSATRAPTAVATPVTTDCVYHKGIYYQIGDIVSMMDVNGGTYYAQIRGLLQDQYCEKSAVITWLLPTEFSPKGQFDPSTYILGPEEEVPRKLDCMEFICHAPSDYFKANNSPYPTIPQKPELCFVWTRLRPQIRPVKQGGFVL